MENLYSGPELKDLSIQVIQESRTKNEVQMLEQRFVKIKEELEQAEAEKNKEVKESDNIKNNFLMKLLFSSKVDKEELEAYVAQERYNVALEEYNTVNTQLQNAKRKLAKLDGCKEKYERKYEARRTALLAEKGENADKILELEKEIDTLTVDCKEAKEALDVCNKAFETAMLMSNRINDAKYTAKMDGYLKNTPADLVKLNSEIEAIKLAKELSRLLQRLNREVRDIVYCVEIRKACLDMNSAHWYRMISPITELSEVEDIKKMSGMITEMADDISKVRKEIEAYISECKTKLSTKETELKEIIFQ